MATDERTRHPELEAERALLLRERTRAGLWISVIGLGVLRVADYAVHRDLRGGVPGPGGAVVACRRGVIVGGSFCMLNVLVVWPGRR